MSRAGPRLVLSLIALVGTTAAGPQRSLPVPPIPPASAPSQQTAPLPDPDTVGPMASYTGPRVEIKDFRVRPFKQGMGYAPGSQFESSEDKRSIQTPGVSVRVPLQ